MVMKIEQAIQRALVAWIKENYPHVNIAASQNENSYHAVDLGMDIGEPDLRLMWGEPTIFFFLELKKKRGKLLPAQIKWNANFDSNYKCSYATRDVAYGFSHAKEILTRVLSTTQ